MRIISRIPAELERTLRRTEKRDAALAAFLTSEIEDAFAARFRQDALHQELWRMYNGVPKVAMRSVPIENAPNIEITLGAIACDAIYAQAVELMFAMNPILTARATQSDPERTTDAKAMQRWINWGVANEWNLRPAAELALLDDVQLGTGVLYVPWTEQVKKTDVARVTDRGPRLAAIPSEDFLTPAGAYSEIHDMRWRGHRMWLSKGDLDLRRKRLKWKTDGFGSTADLGWMRSKRELLGHVSGANINRERYEVIEWYGLYDYDGDGEDEDLCVIFDRTSHAIGHVGYCAYDLDPYEAMRYQLRPYLFGGIGVLEMIAPYEDEATENHNHRSLNQKLANTRMWKARTGALPAGQMTVYPNKVVELNDVADLEPMQLADVYPSGVMDEASTISLAEKRVGVNDLTTASRPSSILGSRTPGITALSFIQQQNRRFAPAFDSMRLTIAAAVRQCLLRYRERLLAGDMEAEASILRVLGAADGQRVLRVLREPGFDEAMSIELTASSASVNKEVERQNALLLVNVLGQYYQQFLSLMGIAANPQTPEAVKSTIQKILDAGTELMERTIRTFDQIRDPESFLVHADEEMASLPNAAENTMLGLQNILAGLGGGGGPEGQAGGQPNGPLAPPALPNDLPNSGGGSV